MTSLRVAQRTISQAVVYGAYEAASALAPVISSKSLPTSALAGIHAQLAASNFQGKSQEVRLLFGVPGIEAPIIGVVGLGKPAKDVHVAAENCPSSGSICYQCYSPARQKAGYQWTSEGAHLSTYAYDDLKGVENKASPVTVSAIEGAFEKNEWHTGSILAQSQNFARQFTETPANYMTPTIFATTAVNIFQGIPNVTVVVRDRDFMEEQKMGSFLSVARGSDEPPKLLEVHYNGGAVGEKPLAFVGKGVTFDTGGISLKPPGDMALMRGDMGGAACVLAATWGIAKLGLPINLVTVTPLTENMPSGHATKPGDVVVAMNGKTIEVDNTDAEGRLILADAIYYAGTKFQPHSLVELSTLTGAMVIALGLPFAGVFSSSDELWKKLEAAGEKAGDPFWRMPLSDKYRKQISSHVADLKNVGGRPGGSCAAAIFLKEFVPTLPAVEGSDEPAKLALDYAHVDIAGVMDQSSPSGYLAKGMTGRPTRSLIAWMCIDALGFEIHLLSIAYLTRFLQIENAALSATLNGQSTSWLWIHYYYYSVRQPIPG
ncbi:hypothetical protein BASA83_003383 [Batrachochytrium salamandrivorans]|nr:hypothetical protein BASA83_003383 [Batrachochytrium salamandrivorans]